ncbi:phosphoethanolamine transferase [Cellvibrio sp. UBA7671]|uniref:phosphoethanolamine transferase n=1 Tax=Cellvibrio sp. UBA7671 TaxID=1946312 RepID=UPI002F35BBEF
MFSPLLLKSLLLPLLVLLLAGVFASDREHGFDLLHIASVLLSACFIYGIFLYIGDRKILRLFFSFFLCIELFTRLAYESSVSISMIISSVNTSPRETYEFINFHFKYLLIVLVCWCALSYFPAHLFRNYKSAITVVGVFYLILPAVPVAYATVASNQFEQQMRAARARGLPVGFAKVEIVIENISERFSPLHMVKGFVDLYLITSSKVSTDSTWTNVTAATTPRLLILAIGESQRAANMSLYGYPRDTTPRLLAHYKNNIINHIPQAYAAGPTTWTALPATLTMGATTPDFSKSIINLAKDAGYKTYWLSNQGRYGATDRSVAALAHQADVEFFYKSQGFEAGFDSVLIDELNRVLARDSGVKKKLIVLHLYGSHMQFNQRYPQEFDSFKSANSLVDHYDNSILYGDFILDQVINIARKNHGEFLYFADHGLRHADLPNPLTHDNVDNPNLDSLHVPLIYSVPSAIKQRTVFSLFYFECLFSEWAQVTADQLAENNYCSNEDAASIHFFDVKLMLREVKLQ